MSHCGHCYGAARSSGCSRRLAEAACRELGAWGSDSMVRSGHGHHPTVHAVVSQLAGLRRIDKKQD